jgi:hypothetical protein
MTLASASKTTRQGGLSGSIFITAHVNNHRSYRLTFNIFLSCDYNYCNDFDKFRILI